MYIVVMKFTYCLGYNDKELFFPEFLQGCICLIPWLSGIVSFPALCRGFPGIVPSLTLLVNSELLTHRGRCQVLGLAMFRL
jgi:hypothetical protein